MTSKIRNKPSWGFGFVVVNRHSSGDLWLGTKDGRIQFVTRAVDACVFVRLRDAEGAIGTHDTCRYTVEPAPWPYPRPGEIVGPAGL